MKLKTDEDLPLEAATILRQSGFDVETVWDEALSGADDHTVSAGAQREGRVLLTLDLDFANIQAYPPDQHVGIIVLRLRTQDKPTILAYISRIMLVLVNRNPAGELWIVEQDRIRYRQGN